MSKNRVTGHLLSAVSVRYLSQEMETGRYTTSPSGTVPANSDTQIFVAEPLAGALAGAVGENKWMAADGTIFKFTFNNFHHNNEATANMSDVGGPWLLPTPDFPDTGWDWTVTYKIDHEAGFFDAPVFADDILAAPRCDTFSDDILKRWLGGRTGVTLGDVMGASTVPLEARLWCAAQALFLTRKSKHLLLADLAASSLVDNADLVALAKAATDLHIAAADGAASPAEFSAYAKQVDAARETLPVTPAFGALSSMVGANPDVAWSNCVYALVGSPEDEGRDNAVGPVLDLVSKRL